MRTFGAFEWNFFCENKVAFSGGCLLRCEEPCSFRLRFHSIHSVYMWEKHEIKQRSKRMPTTSQTASTANEDRTECVTRVHHKMQNNISCCKMFVTATVAFYFLLLVRGSSPSFIFYHLRAGAFIFSCLTIKTATSLTKWTHNMRQSPYFCCPHQEPSLLTSLTTSSGLIYPWPASLKPAGETGSKAAPTLFMSIIIQSNGRWSHCARGHISAQQWRWNTCRRGICPRCQTSLIYRWSCY